ncbi:MAG: hypothetical protein ACYSTF_05165 [Planctomycetota bacterium]|jgi:hypothetical protein
MDCLNGQPLTRRALTLKKDVFGHPERNAPQAEASKNPPFGLGVVMLRKKRLYRSNGSR